MTKRIIYFTAIFMALLTATPLMAGLTVEGEGSAIRVLRDGKPLIESIAIDLALPPMEMSKLRLAETAKRSQQVLPDGTKVWNEWNEERQTRYRIEVAQRTDGAVEISMTGEMEALNPYMTRLIHLTMPQGILNGKPFDALEGNGRKYTRVNGVCDTAYKGGNYRWFTADGLIFDFNPFGATDYCSGYGAGAVKGVWNITPAEGGKYVLTAGSSMKNYGGFTGGKLVIREGTFDDYGKYHLIDRFGYSQHLFPSRLLAFGADKTGKQYSNGNIPFDEKLGYGWTSGSPTVINGYKEGALYSHVTGTDATYTVTGFQDGFYVLTVGAGNYTGAPNRFSVDVNGVELAPETAIGPRKVFYSSRAIRITGGKAEFHFKGSYILSVIGVQPLMGDGEDFFIQRGFWVSRGYEPASIYRSCDYDRKAVLRIFTETYDLPVPGTETSATPKAPPRPVKLPDPNQPSLAWMKNAQFFRNLSNSATLAEMADPQVCKAYLDKELEGKSFNAMMVSGMHSRHTYFNHIDRGIEAIGKLAQEAHARGMKLIDHHDSTLLWNVDAGLRTLAERLPEVGKALNDNLPSFQFCPSNPTFCETYYAYLRRLVEAGVDGFQIDELCFWPHSCSCQFCREKFHKETGWILPVNELDKNFNNPNSELMKRWFDWRIATITNWFVELRTRLEDIKPDLVLCNYTTHWGFTRSLPRHNASSCLIENGRAMNFFGTEVMTRNVMQSSRPLLPYRKMKNLLSVAYKAPVWGWYYCSDWQTNYFSWCVGNMTGQAALLSTVEEPPEMPKFEQFAATPANMNKQGATQIAEVALLFSSTSRDWNSYIGFDNELFGLAQALEALHIPYEFIGDMSVNPEQLAKYKALMVCASGCLSDDEISVIREFAERGGIVQMTTIAGYFDEFGKKRDKWPFEDIMGFAVEHSSNMPKIDSIDTGNGIVKLDAPMTSFVPAKYKINLLGVEKPYGKGRIFYRAVPLAAKLKANETTPPQKWTYNADPKLEAYYRSRVAALLKPASYWQVSLPDKVYTTIWREANGSQVIHFLNATGANIKYDEVMKNTAPNPAFPQLAEDIVFTIPAPACQSVCAYSPDFAGERKLAFTQNADGTITATLPKELLKAYTIVRMK